MEVNNNTNGVTINPNVKTSVKPINISEFRDSKKSQEAVSASLANNESGQVESRRDSEKPKVVGQKPEEAKGEKDNIINFADALVEKAKKDGVDSVFEKLAIEDIDDEEEEKRVEVKPEVKEVKSVEPDAKELQQPAKKEDAMLIDHVVQLQQRVEALTADNTGLKDRLDSLTEMNKQSLMTSYELALMLKKLIEDIEEDEEKKKGMLASVVNIMTKIMIKIMVGEEEEEPKKEEEKDENLVEQMIA